MTAPRTQTRRTGFGGNGPSYQDLLDLDSKPVPASLRRDEPGYFGDADIPVGRYLSREFHELEKTRLWSRVWQFACREEVLAEVGDTEVYDICDTSILIVRAAPGPDGIKAYYNACLHRGRTLRDARGHVDELLCPFHGFCWSLNGRLKRVPSAWDFPQVRPGRFRLPEVRVGTWGGFVFINPDPDAEPFEAFLGTLPDHFARWDFEHRYLQAHVAKKIRCNWKIAQEAFDEGLHLGATHPQSAPYVGDANAAVDVYGNYSRQISPSGTPIEDMPGEASEADILKRMLDVREGEDLPIPFSQRSTARDAMAEAGRDRWRQVLGDEADDISDAELVDHWNYAVFPNLHPWGGYNRIVYRFRPNGDRHDESIFEVMFLTPYRGERPPTAQVTQLDFGEPWTNAPELQTLGLVMEQDTFNMEAVQRGLETTRRQYVTASKFQEGMITWRHDLLTKWIG